MKTVVFFHRDLFRSERLIPGESKRIVVSLAESMDVRLLGRAGEHIPPSMKEQSHEYKTPAGMLSQLLMLRGQGSPLMVIESPLTADSILCTLFCTILDYDIVFQPFAQFTSYVMSRRLFGANPDVKALDHSTGKQGIKGHGKSVFLKKLTLVLMKACFQLKGVGWIVLSKFEQDEVSKLFPKATAVPFIHVPWAIGESAFVISEPDYFERFPVAHGKVKLVLWSRLDYELKGIDRLLAGIAADSVESAARYHVFLIGPDYAGGLAKTESRIKELGIGDRVTIIGPDQYTSGDQSPLATADGSILLSRWDGFPRALRESVQLGVPMLVSPETHFSELIGQTGCGVSIPEPDCPDAVCNGIRTLVEGILGRRYVENSFFNARNVLAPARLAAVMKLGIQQFASKSAL